MKKTSTTVLFSLMCTAIFAQKPFPTVYKSAWPVSVDSRYSNSEKTLALGGDMKAISMMDATNGKILCTINFKEKLGLKKANDWGWSKEAGYVWVTIKTDNKDVEQTLYYDERSG